MKRILTHLWYTQRHIKQVLSEADFAAIEQAIAESEKTHGGEICFAIEAALPVQSILAGQAARERALEVFGKLRVWDTRHNNGVLLYLLLADRQIEIVADRGAAQIDFEPICKKIEAALAGGNFRDGIIQGLNDIGTELAKLFPAADRNELSNKPQRL